MNSSNSSIYPKLFDSYATQTLKYSIDCYFNHNKPIII